MNEQTQPAAAGPVELVLGPLPEPAGFRTRYRSEPGMIGHYPWTYADQRRRKYDRPECEYEDLFTAEQLRAAAAAERERLALACWERRGHFASDAAARAFAELVRDGRA